MRASDADPHPCAGCRHAEFLHLFTVPSPACCSLDAMKSGRRVNPRPCPEFSPVPLSDLMALAVSDLAGE